MAEWTTESGLVVTDRRTRTEDRSLFPRDVVPNGNDPVGPVGPNTPSGGGFGATHVMYDAAQPPVQAQAWDGWPVGWAPPSNYSAGPGWDRRLDTVWSCLDLNASVLASMPAYAVKNAKPLPDPTWLANPEPLVYTSFNEFAEQLWWCYQAVGEVFVMVTARGSDGYPQRFMVLNPAFVDVDIDGTGRRSYRIGGAAVDPADLCHIRYKSWPSDAHGHGPLEAAGLRLVAAEVLTRYAMSLAADGGIPWAVIRVKDRLRKGQAQQIQMQYVNSRRSAMGAPAVLDEDAELLPLATTPRDMALAELAGWNESRLAVLLGVPPFLVGMKQADGMTYSNATGLFDFHWRSSLRPKAQKVMAALSNWLLPRGTGIELNRDEYVRPGLYERAQAYQLLNSIVDETGRALTAAEIRVLERFAPAPTAAAQLSGTVEITDSAPPTLTAVPGGQTGEAA